MTCRCGHGEPAHVHPARPRDARCAERACHCAGYTPPGAPPARRWRMPPTPYLVAALHREVERMRPPR